MDVAWASFWEKAGTQNLVFFPVKWLQPAMQRSSCVCGRCGPIRPIILIFSSPARWGLLVYQNSSSSSASSSSFSFSSSPILFPKCLAKLLANPLRQVSRQSSLPGPDRNEHRSTAGPQPETSRAQWARLDRNRQMECQKPNRMIPDRMPKYQNI